MKKHFLLLLSAIFIVCLLLLFDIEIVNPSLATDSGFDTSYDSGGFSGGSSGGFSSGGGSSGFSSSSGSSGERSMTEDELCYFLLMFPAILSAFWQPKKKWKKVCKVCLRISLVIIYILTFNYSISSDFDFTTVIVMFISGATLLASFVEDSQHINDHSYTMTDSIEKEYRIRNYMTNSSISLNNIEKERIFKQSYQIYLQVQQAWMNFDYEKLRTLVTDELFNTYQTQLQTLELKGQKNIMKDFILLDWKFLSANEENSIRTVTVMLEVEFFDYIVDNQNKVVRGNKKDKVIMTYCLTFVENKEKEEICPHCGAKLEDGKTICPYCKTNIQGITAMKLSKKEAIFQRIKR